MDTSNGGAKGGGLPGVKKQKYLNAYVKGGLVKSGLNPTSGKARGAGKAVKGFDYKEI